jgi:acyl-CoA dehydrogenase
VNVDLVRKTLVEFMEECVYPAEMQFQEYAVSGGPAERPLVMDELAEEARRRGH